MYSDKRYKTSGDATPCRNYYSIMQIRNSEISRWCRCSFN